MTVSHSEAISQTHLMTPAHHTNVPIMFAFRNTYMRHWHCYQQLLFMVMIVKNGRWIQDSLSYIHVYMYRYEEIIRSTNRKCLVFTRTFGKYENSWRYGFFSSNFIILYCSLDLKNRVSLNGSPEWDINPHLHPLKITLAWHPGHLFYGKWEAHNGYNILLSRLLRWTICSWRRTLCLHYSEMRYSQLSLNYFNP